MTSPDRLAIEIQDRNYLRERISPHPKDHLYLCLSDLLLALEKVRSDKPQQILDYGCGGSPYRFLFPNAEYKRADYLQTDAYDLDYALNEDSRVSERDESFDLILSTQVAEHVKSPQTYFSECYRLLKPQGRLICSTHGYFPDHGCPYDFQRWTSEGLVRDLTNVGFEIGEIYKLTTGSRAFFSIFDVSLSSLRLPRSTITGVSFLAAIKIFSFFRPTIYRQLDRLRESERVVIDNENKHTFYIGLMAVGTK
jgi:SAM-dependent methyltransferase